MKTIAVVVTYNRCELLRQCLEKLKNQTVPCEILIVDNASEDDTREYMRTQLPTIHYLCLESNTGGAGGFHAGMHWAMARDYDYLWLMDDDTFPEPDALEKLLEAAEKLDQHFGWLSSQALWTDGTLCGMNVQRSTPYRDIVDFQGSRIPAAMASFVSLLLPRESLRKYGYPVKEFFIWTDDWEYTRRISRQERCYVIPASRVVHAMRRNTVANIATDSVERLERYRYLYRNDVYLYRQEGLRGWCWLLAKDAWHTLQTLLRRKDGRGRAIRIIWSSFREGCRFHPAAELGETYFAHGRAQQSRPQNSHPGRNDRHELITEEKGG